MPLVVQYWANLQSVHGLPCYGNITRTRNLSEYTVVLSLSLVVSTGSSFRRHFGEKPILWVFLGPISPLLWGYEADIWGHILRLGLNMRGKFQGRSSRASYICQVSHVGILGVSAQH